MEERELSPLFLIILLLLITISCGFGLGGSFLPPRPRGRPDGTPKPPL
jgi:hypothetical protein